MKIVKLISSNHFNLNDKATLERFDPGCTKDAIIETCTMQYAKITKEIPDDSPIPETWVKYGKDIPEYYVDYCSEKLVNK